MSIYETRNPKPENDFTSWFQAKSETRNPKPENDSNPTFEVALQIGTPSYSIIITGCRDHFISSSLHGEFVSCFLVFPLSQFHSDLPETRDSRDVPFRGRRWILNLKLMWRKGAKSTWACEKILDKPGSPQNSLLRKEKLNILPTSSWNLGLYPHFRTNPLEKTTAEIASNSDWVCQILSIGYTKIHCVMSFIIKKNYLERKHHPTDPSLQDWFQTQKKISHLVNIPDQSLFRKCAQPLHNRYFRQETDHETLAVALLQPWQSVPCCTTCKRRSHLTFLSDIVTESSPTITNHHILALWNDTPIQWLFQSQHFYKTSITINNRSLW